MIEDEHDGCANLVHFVRLSETAKMPTYATEGSAGMDLYASESVWIEVGYHRLVSTGIAIALPPMHEGQVRPRSGLALKHGITVLNSPGTIDSDYRGPIGVMLYNAGQTDYLVDVGDRIGQLVVTKYERMKMREKLSLDTTVRGASGFGSTGNR